MSVFDAQIVESIPYLNYGRGPLTGGEFQTIAISAGTLWLRLNGRAPSMIPNRFMSAFG